MNHTIKILSLITVLSGLSILSSCKKGFLDQKPQGEILVEDFETTPEGALLAVNATYSQLRQWTTVCFGYVTVTNITSDDADKGSSASDADFINAIDNFTHDASAFMFNDYWIGQYALVTRANTAINMIPAIQMDETLKARYLGEAKFLRAYAYFNLVRGFGGVPLITQRIKDGDPPVPRSTKEQVYELIVQDLTDAIAGLPQLYDPNEIGRATKGAAQAWLAKVRMYQGNWGEVLNLTNQILNAKTYNLFPDYATLFRQGGENSPESVFEIQCGVSPSCPPEDIDHYIKMGSQWAEIQNPRGVPNGGWGFNVPSTDLEAAYEAGDVRKDATILYRGETPYDGRNLMSATNPMYNEKAYVGNNEPQSPCGLGDAPKNIRVMRFAEVLLMHAEAAANQNQLALAKSSLDSVRHRAGLPGTTANTKDAMIAAVRKDRRVELAMESDRFFDLVRQGRAGTVLRAAGKAFTDNKNELFPIPQAQRDASGGVLTQNPGYN